MRICEQINCFSDSFYSLHQLGSVLYINKALCLWWLFNWYRALVLCMHFVKCSVWLTSWLVRGCMSFQICQCCRDHSVTSSPLTESLSTERSISSLSLTLVLCEWTAAAALSLGWKGKNGSLWAWNQHVQKNDSNLNDFSLVFTKAT